MSPHTMECIAGKINATVRGWIDYYGAFFKSEMKSLLIHLNFRFLKNGYFERVGAHLPKASEFSGRILLFLG